MYGLRKMNNSYVANGTGRDAIILFDPAFNVGKRGTSCLRPGPNPYNGGPPQFGSPNAYYAFKHPPVGDPWQVGGGSVRKSHSQRDLHNCSTSALKTREILTKSAETEKKLVQSFSLPSLGCSETPWSRCCGHDSIEYPVPVPLQAQAQAHVEMRRPEAAIPSTPPKQNYPYPPDADRNQYYGFARTAYGGLWKVNSFVGPG